MIKEHASGKVSVNLLNLRSKPNGKVIKVLPQFTRMDIICRDGEWFEVVVEGIPGFVSSQYVDVENNQQIPEKKPKIGFVTATHLNFRKTPKGTIIKSLPQNTQVIILSEENGWLKISVGDVTGYVSKDYIGEQAIEERTPTKTKTSAAENFHFQDK